jgi:integrase
MPLAAVRTIDIVNLFRGIRTGTERPVSQRTVYNIYSVVAAMFRDAQLADRIERSPCVLGKRQLGPLTDKDPEWRSGAVFTRAEAEEILSTSAIPADRQMAYGLELLAGVRPGEAAGLRSWGRNPRARTLPCSAMADRVR